MRLAVVYIAQESNTFNPRPSTLEGFEAFGLDRGQAVIDNGRGVGTIGGFLEAIESSGKDVELVPIIKARDVAGGRLADEVLAQFTDEMVAGLRAAGDLDGFALLMHGA